MLEVVILIALMMLPLGFVRVLDVLELRRWHRKRKGAPPPALYHENKDSFRKKRH